MSTFHIKKSTQYSIDCYMLSSKQESSTIILYLHGGAYMNQPMAFHWQFLARLTKKYPCTILVPIYPKAPKHHCLESMGKLEKIYSKLLETHLPENIVFMGDSAGGGFALSLAMKLRDEKISLPRSLILLSPWLDITMQNRDIIPLEKADPMLDSITLSEIGKLYAGDLDYDSFLISPINGEFNDLPKITLFVGTREIFLPDCRILKALAVAQKIPINYYEYEGMNHVFPLYPIPEAKLALKQIVETLSNN